MANVDVKTEEDTGHGWKFQVAVDEDGRRHDFDVTLNWADYDLWCHGQVSPERVIKAAFAFLLSREPVGAIMRKFDCAVIRRYFPEVDKELKSLL
ncbi:MAG: hypothetical protein GC162_20940 [Planctomycetes bacterium]|nr:hypothetical protein [Planctomycetota bacterium]